MEFSTFICIALAIDVILIGYGQAQRFDGNPCFMHDGSRARCKHIDHCESIKEGIRAGTFQYSNIVGCSFEGNVQIVCCADDTQSAGRNRPPRPPFSTPRPTPNTDFVFVDREKTIWPLKQAIENNIVRLPSIVPSVWNAARNELTDFILPSEPRRRFTTTTTMKPVQTTAVNTFWLQPTPPFIPNKEDQRTTSEMPSWMKGVLNEYSSTPDPNSIRHIFRTTTSKRPTTTNSFWGEWSVTNPTEPTKNPNALPWMHNPPTIKTTSAPMIVTTTPKPKTTTMNSFWSQWSANNPTNGEPNQGWESNNNLQELVTTTKKSDMLPWMQDILNDYSTTTKATVIISNAQNNQVIQPSTAVDNELPSWMRDVLNEYSTTGRSTGVPVPFVDSTTKKSSFGDGSDFFGGGSGNIHSSTKNSNENESSTFNRPTPGQVTRRPTDSTKSRYSTGSKAESACARYALLPTVSTISFNILGGVPTNIGEFPWMAALGYDDNNNGISYDCGGTLISDRYILTAAHCTPARRPPQTVRLGKVTLLTNDDDAIPLDLNVQEIIRHPNYKTATKKNDIALIRVAEPIDFNENIRPACLRTELNDVLPDTNLIITGWGTVSAERTVRPTVLLKTNVTSVPLSFCNTTLLNYNRDANQPSLRGGLIGSQCCAFDPAAKNDACQGDSGGPLQYYPNNPDIATVIGVVSFGISCGTSLPSIYTRVASYLDWIEPIVWPN